MGLCLKQDAWRFFKGRQRSEEVRQLRIKMPSNLEKEGMSII